MKTTEASMYISEHQQDENLTAVLGAEDTLGKLKWTHEALLCLISLYKDHLKEFLSTTEKNDKVWNRVSLELIGHGFQYTANQCKFKFKYLKCKYMQKKDNMKNTSTGQACIKFQYFNQMDEIFGSKANVNPTSLASNLIKRNVLFEENKTENTLLAEEKTETSNNKKKESRSQKSNIEKLIYEMRETSKAQETSRLQRHEDNMNFKRELLQSFNEKMDLMIDALKQK